MEIDGKLVADGVSNEFIKKHGKKLRRALNKVEMVRPYTFNINDDLSDVDESEYRKDATNIAEWLESYFPDKAKWELYEKKWR